MNAFKGYRVGCDCIRCDEQRRAVAHRLRILSPVPAPAPKLAVGS